MNRDDLHHTATLFRKLDQEQLGALIQVARETSYKSDTVIMRYGDRDRDIIVILEGAVSVEIPTGDNQYLQVARLGQYETIGEMNFILPLRRTAQIKAIQDVSCLVFDYYGLCDFFRKNPEIALKVFEAINVSMVEKLGRSIDHLVETSSVAG